jgi:hypothetical protein
VRPQIGSVSLEIDAVIGGEIMTDPSGVQAGAESGE